MDIGPHRRYTWVDAELAGSRAIKDALGGTLNDVVLAAVSLALGDHLRARGTTPRGSPCARWCPCQCAPTPSEVHWATAWPRSGRRCPWASRIPRSACEQIRLAMEDLKRSGQAVGAQMITNLAGFAPPTILSQAARLQARQRFFNLVVTNVPGPQFPLYLLGHRLQSLYPVVPLARKQALGIAVMSYDGQLGFGLLADYDAIPALEEIARELEGAIERLAGAAGLRPARARDAAVTARGRARKGSSAGNGATAKKPARQGMQPRRPRRARRRGMQPPRPRSARRRATPPPRPPPSTERGGEESRAPALANLAVMCRNIRTLHNFEPPATEDEVHGAALQYVRKISGFTKPSQANAEAFERAVEEVAEISARLLDQLVTSAPPKDREVEAMKRRERSAQRFAA